MTVNAAAQADPSPQSFDAFFDKYKRFIQYAALEYYSDGLFDQDDLFQEASQALYRVWQNYAGKRHLDLMARTSIRNAFRNLLRGALRTRKREYTYSEILTTEAGFRPNYNQEYELAGEEYIALLRSKLDQDESAILKEMLFNGAYKCRAGIPQASDLAAQLQLSPDFVMEKLGSLRNKAVDVAREEGFALAGVL